MIEPIVSKVMLQRFSGRINIVLGIAWFRVEYFWNDCFTPLCSLLEESSLLDDSELMLGSA